MDNCLPLGPAGPSVVALDMYLLQKMIDWKCDAVDHQLKEIAASRSPNFIDMVFPEIHFKDAIRRTVAAYFPMILMEHIKSFGETVFGILFNDFRTGNNAGIEFTVLIGNVKFACLKITFVGDTGARCKGTVFHDGVATLMLTPSLELMFQFLFRCLIQCARYNIGQRPDTCVVYGKIYMTLRPCMSAQFEAAQDSKRQRV
jgi:hypothetical protein